MKSRFAALAVTAALAAPVFAHAAVWDAFASFDGTNTTTNRFSYIGYSGGLAQNPQAMAAPGLCGFSTTCLESASGNEGFYKAGANTPASVTRGNGSVVTVPQHQLVVQPGFLGATVLFYAPRTAAYTFKANFTGLESLANGVTVVRAALGFSNVVVLANSVPANAAYSETLNMTAGQWGGFFVGPGRVADNDLTGLNFTVSGPVPEPGAWALMITGFVAAGATLRRRRALRG